MGSGETLRQASRLDTLFAILLEEARARPDFASRLLDALTDGPAEDFGMPDDAEETPYAVFSFAAVLHTEGEERLRQCLAIITSKEQLLELAADQHIPVEGDFSDASLDAVVDAVIEGAKFRLQDRMSAAI
jgi:hypothetical protein